MSTLTSERASLPAGTSQAVVARIWPAKNPWCANPAGWIGERLHEELWAKQLEIAQALVDHGHVAVPSCHSSGKSFLAARLAAWWIDTHPPGDAKVVTTAPSQHQVKTVLWGEIASAHERGQLRGKIGAGQVPEWKIGGQVVAFGRKPQDLGSPEQAMQAFQGFHAPNMLVILDEACGIPKWLYDAAETLATGEHDRVLAIGNPDDPTSEFNEVCKPGSGWKVIPISAFDTPRFTGEPVDERIPFVSRRWVELRKEHWGEDSTLYQSKVLGQFPDVSDDALFPPRILNKAIDADLPGLDRGGYGGDVARMGADETVVYRNRGGVIRRAASARKQDTTATTGMFAQILNAHGADRVPMNVDADGIGAGPFDSLRAQGLPVHEFRGGFEAYDKQRFGNRRAEVYWVLREDMDAGLVDIDPDDLELHGQLSKLKWRLDPKGRIFIESKDDMRKRGVKSPDRADAVAMAYACPAAIPESLLEEINEAAGGSYTNDLLDREM